LEIERIKENRGVVVKEKKKVQAGSYQIEFELNLGKGTFQRGKAKKRKDTVVARAETTI